MSAAEDLSSPANEVGSDVFKALLESLRQVDHSQLQALRTRGAVEGNLTGRGYLSQPELGRQGNVPVTQEMIDWRRAPLLGETIQ